MGDTETRLARWVQPLGTHRRHPAGLLWGIRGPRFKSGRPDWIHACWMPSAEPAEKSTRIRGMSRRQITVLAVASAVAALVAPPAEAKFKVWLTFKPAQPIVRQPVRMTMRTEIVLPKGQSMTVIAVGPWRQQSGQAVRYARLVRIGPRSFRATLRFPYAGRWRLQVISEPGSASLPPTFREVRVLPPT
jgi:hypothetical protein